MMKKMCLRKKELLLTLTLTIAMALMALPAVAGESAPALFQDGDRVCFIGDSITHGDLGQSDYHEFIYLYYLTRFPDRTITIFDRGISGDTSWGTIARYGEDIAPCKATVSTIMLGMNDVDRGLYGSSTKVAPAIQKKREAKLAKYRESMTTLCERIVNGGGKLILFTPSPYDQVTLTRNPERLMASRPRVNDGLLECTKSVRSLAKDLSASVVDMNTGVLDVLARQHKVDRTYSFFDKLRVHPDMRGHFVMAYLFLKAQKAPGTVSAVEIDAAGKKTVAME
ncbi:MAG: SGNH/GDSL hydrolase family protein, partial [Planctomycetota bacterium]